MKTSRALRVGCGLSVSVALLVVADRVLMLTHFRYYREILNDVDHWPEPDEVEFNADGLRDRREAEAFAEEAFNVLILGDSFVYGYRLWPHEAIPQQLERRLREAHPERSINVINFGWISSSPYLSLRRLRAIGSAYAPDLVVLCIDMTDFHDDLKYEAFDRRSGLLAPFGVLPGWTLLSKEVAARLDLHERLFGYPADRFFVVKQPLDESREYLEPFRRNVDGIADFARTDLDAEFLLVVFPRPFQYSDRESPKSWERHLYRPLGPHVLEPFRFIDELRTEVDYSVRSLLPIFEETETFPTTFFDDPHWNLDGNELATTALMGLIEERLP